MSNNVHVPHPSDTLPQNQFGGQFQTVPQPIGLQQINIQTVPVAGAGQFQPTPNNQFGAGYQAGYTPQQQFAPVAVPYQPMMMQPQYGIGQMPMNYAQHPGTANNQIQYQQQQQPLKPQDDFF